MGHCRWFGSDYDLIVLFGWVTKWPLLFTGGLKKIKEMLSEAVENVGSQSQEKMLNPHKPLVNRNEFSIKTEIRKRKNGELKWDKSTGFRFRRTHLGLE